MNNNEIEYIEKFNDTQAFFGNIDTDLMNDDSENHVKLFYLFPMIERIIRLILNQYNDSDIESLDNNKHRTLNSINKINYAVLQRTVDEPTLLYILELYKDGGLRNKFMHYNESVTFDIGSIMRIQNLFLKLIQIYMDEFINE